MSSLFLFTFFAVWEKRLEFIMMYNYEYLSIFSTSQVTLLDNCGVFHTGIQNQFWNSANIITKYNFESIFPSNEMNLVPKGQLILKCLFVIFNSPIKRTKKFDFTTMVPQVELFSFIF